MLTKKENSKLIEVFRSLELSTVYETGVRKISGGFATADYDSDDENFIYITLKWGVQSDVENHVYTEKYKLPRDVLGMDISVRQMRILILEA